MLPPITYVSLFLLGEACWKRIFYNQWRRGPAKKKQTNLNIDHGDANWTIFAIGLWRNGPNKVMLYSRTWICYSQLSKATLCQSCSVHDLNKKKGRKQNWKVGNWFKVIILSVLSAKENKWKDPFIFCHSPHFWAISVRLLCRRSVCATAAWEGGGVRNSCAGRREFWATPQNRNNAPTTA